MEEYLLSKVLDPILSKLADYALGDEHTSVFKSLDNHFKLLRARASDFVEQIGKAELSGIKKRKREVKCWLEQVESIGSEVGTLINDIQTRGFVMKSLSENRAKKLDARVSELIEQSKDIGELVVDDHKVQGDLFLTKALVGDGFKENVEKIWTLLVTEKVKCIGIYGMGGAGKTILAKHINNRLVEERQYLVVWITISEQYSVSKLQDEIAKDLRIDISDLREEDKRSTRLNKELSKLKNVVLIFDDVWQRIDLMKMGNPLSIEGCSLVITTRSQQVCHQIGCSEIIDVKRLQENEAWILFKGIHGQRLNLSPEVESIVKTIVEKCKGLPLGIITLAGSMRGETASHAWSDVLAQLNESVMGQHDMSQEVFKVLKLSFDRLALRGRKRNGYSKSQLCFLYCSLYPEDHEIDREGLIRRFVVEDYLDRKESREALFNEGHTILDNLVYACLLERGRFGGVKMHDLLRAMALKITEDKTRVFDGRKSSLKDIPNEELWMKDIEKIFLWNVSCKSVSDMMPPNCPKLSTLRLTGDSIHYMSRSFFSQMHCLCTLDVSCSTIEVFPDSLSDMVSLKALFLTECRNLRYVPNLGKLKKLEELDLSVSGIEGSGIKEVPQGIEELVNLKFLSFCGTYKMKRTSILVLNFTNIQCLLLPNQIDLTIEEVVALKHMEEFQGRLKDVGDFHRLIKSRPKLRYRIIVGQYWGCYLNLYSLVRFNELRLPMYDFKKASDEDLAWFFKANILHLVLHECEWQSNCIVEDVSRMCNPTSLVSLRVEDGEGLECLLRREHFLDRGISPPLAQTLFSDLKKLIIGGCHKVKKLGLLPSQFPSLKEITIYNCSEIEEVMEVGEENGTGEPIVFLHNLKRLYLWNLPRLKSICNATMVCTSIQFIQVDGCQELKKLPLVFGQPNDSPPPSTLRICLKKGEEEWGEALELGHPNHRQNIFIYYSN